MARTAAAVVQQIVSIRERVGRWVDRFGFRTNTLRGFEMTWGRRHAHHQEGSAMAFHLVVPFLSEAASLRRDSQAAQRLTPTQRLCAVVDTLSAAETLSHAGGVREAQLKYHERLEEEWQRLMKEFIQHHVAG